jgi:cytochrome c
MSDKTNTIAGWTLAGCFVALGATIVGGMIFHSPEPKKEGFPVEAVNEGGDSGAAAEVPIASLLPTADAAKGAEVFKKCGACHTVNQGGANGIGPNLYATVGEAVAEGKGGFAFSDALKAKGGKWDFDSLNAWLTSPRKYAPGTKMTFAGLSNPKDRADVILYLNTQGSNQPLPPPPAAAPAGNAATPAPNNASAPVSPNDGKGAAASGAETVGNPMAPSGAPSKDPNAAKRAPTK